jgi:hypothetical protein
MRSMGEGARVAKASWACGFVRRATFFVRQAVLSG